MPTTTPQGQSRLIDTPHGPAAHAAHTPGMSSLTHPHPTTATAIASAAEAFRAAPDREARRAATATLTATLTDAITPLVRHAARGGAEAEDAVQTALLAALEALHAWADSGAPAAAAPQRVWEAMRSALRIETSRTAHRGMAVPRGIEMAARAWRRAAEAGEDGAAAARESLRRHDHNDTPSAGTMAAVERLAGGTTWVPTPEAVATPTEDVDSTLVVASLLGHLPEGERVLIEMVLGGASQREAARALGTSPATVSRTMTRARAVLAPLAG